MSWRKVNSCRHVNIHKSACVIFKLCNKIYMSSLWGVGRGAGQLTTSLAGAFPDREAREGALSSVSRAFVGGLHHACQAVLHPLESIQLLAGPQQDPWDSFAGDGAAQKATEEEDDEEPGRLHQVWDAPKSCSCLTFWKEHCFVIQSELLTCV